MMKKSILTAVLSCIAAMQVFGQSRAMEDKFFPEPTIEIPTPAFEKASGFTKYRQMKKFVQEVTANKDFVTVDDIGTSQRGRKIIRVRINKPSEQEKIRVWFQGGLHGNEPASTEGMLFVLHQLLNDKANAHLLDRLDITILPMANPDGYNYQNRYAANGLDLNRDFVKLHAPETNYIRSAFSEFSPQIAIDFHEFNPYRAHFGYFGERGATSAFDAQFLYSSNLNVNEVIRQATKEILVDNTKALLQENGRTVCDYASTRMTKGKLHLNRGSSSPRSSSTNFAMSNTLAVLMEIRGVNLKRISFKRRVETTSLAAMSYLNIAYNQGDEIRAKLEEARLSTLRLEQSIAIKQDKQVLKDAIPFIDLEKEEKVNIDLVVTDAAGMTASQTRVRPHAYILMPTEKIAAEKLKTLGCEIVETQTEKTIEVEYYQVKSSVISRIIYEKIYLRKLTTAVLTTKKTIPAGAFIVYLDQNKANIAPAALEPEDSNSFYTFRVIDGDFKIGSELPVYRYMQKQKI